MEHHHKTNSYIQNRSFFLLNGSGCWKDESWSHKDHGNNCLQSLQHEKEDQCGECSNRQRCFANLFQATVIFKQVCPEFAILIKEVITKANNSRWQRRTLDTCRTKCFVFNFRQWTISPENNRVEFQSLKTSLPNPRYWSWYSGLLQCSWLKEPQWEAEESINWRAQKQQKSIATENKSHKGSQLVLAKCAGLCMRFRETVFYK